MKFMIIGLPRSGTTWAANWLSTDDCLVQHDPLYRAHYTDWDAKFQAVSCTGIWRWPEWVNAQPCPKIILHRPEAEIMSSLSVLGVGDAVGLGEARRLSDLRGSHHAWTRLWDSPVRARRIWKICHPDKPFDHARWLHYREMNIQPQLSRIRPDREATQRLVDEVFDIARKRPYT